MKKTDTEIKEVKATKATKVTKTTKVAKEEKVSKVAKTTKATKATKEPKASKEAKEVKVKTTLKKIDPTQIEINTIVEAMLDKKGKNVCTMDLTKIGTSICDHFVICNADSTTNVMAIADNVEDEMIVKCERKVLRQQGKENAFWIILDYADIVVHIFQTEYRSFYRLEDLWADADKRYHEE